MDYYIIGQQIRKYRKAMGMSQEQLAEAIGISVTHMSHIETANTKLSLPVFVDIATALEVTTDDLLNTPPHHNHIDAELSDLLDQCTATQKRIIIDVVKATKTSLDKHTP